MGTNFRILDMAGARPEHSTVIVNFVAAIREQLFNSTCYVFSDNVQYKWLTKDGEEKTVIPDASINCRTKTRKGNVFLDIPRFVMEGLSPSTENYDRGEKKNYAGSRKLMNTGLLTGKRKRLKFITSIMMKTENRIIICGKQLQSKTRKN